MRKNMPKDDYELFKIIAQSRQSKLQKMLYKLLKRHYKNIINTPDYILARGDIPVALVAHMDTVFKIPPEKIYYGLHDGRHDPSGNPDRRDQYSELYFGDRPPQQDAGYAL